MGWVELVVWVTGGVRTMMLQRGVDIRLSEAVPVRTRRITSLADGLQFQSRERVVGLW